MNDSSKQKFAKFIETVFSGASVGIVLGSALLFVVSQTVYPLVRDGFTAFRGWQFHVPLTSFLFNVKGSPLEMINLMKGPNGLTLIHYPPLRYYLDSLFFIHTGVGVKGFYYCNLFYWCCLCLGTFYLGRKLGRSNIAGALACALSAFLPIVVLHIFAFNVDLPSMTMVILTAALVVKSNYYQSRTWSVVIGVIAGMSALTRPTTIFFIVFISLGALWVESKLIRKKAVHLVLGGVIGAAIMFAYYGPLFEILSGDTQEHIWPSLQAAAHHLSNFLNAYSENVEGVIGPIILISALILVFRKDGPTLFLLTWALGPIILFLFMRAFGFEQLLASLIALMLILSRAFYLTEHLPKIRFAAMTVALVLISLMSYRLWIFGPDRGINEGKVAPMNTMHEVLETQSIRLMQNSFMVYEQNSNFRNFLNRFYPDIAPDRIVIAASDRNDLSLGRNLLGVYLGLDRPETLPTHVYLTHQWAAKKRTAALDEKKEVFSAKLQASDLILWIRRDDPEKDVSDDCTGNGKLPCENKKLLINSSQKKYEVEFPTGRLYFLEPDRNILGPRSVFDGIPVQE